MLAAVKEVSLRADLWQQQGFHELSEAQILQRRVPVVFRVIAYNAGNRDFEGPVGFNDRLATNVEFDKVLSTRKVADASMAKALMSVVPILGFVAADMDRFELVAGASVQAQTSFDRTTGVLRHQIASVKYRPARGWKSASLPRCCSPGIRRFSKPGSALRPRYFRDTREAATGSVLFWP